MIGLGGLEESARQNELRNLGKGIPRQTSSIREGGPAAMLVFMLGIVFFNVVEVSWLSLYFKCVILIILSLAAGAVVGIPISRSKNRSKLIEQQKYREMMEETKQKQIDEMRRNNSNIPDVEREPMGNGS